MLTTTRKLKPILSLSLFTQSSSSSSLLLNPSFSLLTPTTITNPLQIPTFEKTPPHFFFFFFFFRPFSSKHLPLTRDGNYDEATPHNTICPGCGVHMQNTNPKTPGYFTKPVEKNPNYNTHFVPVSTEPEFSISVKKGFVVEPKNIGLEETPEKPERKHEKPIVCARCHSLRHYGKVKDQTVENLMPDFDFDYTVGRRLASISGTRSVVLMVVDAVDFDGSFPKKAAKLVSDTIEENYAAWKQGKSGNVPRVVLVVTKIDLLPTYLSPTRFEHWVRQRAREGGVNKITKLHFVSAVRDWGLKDLVEDVVELVGPRGNVWAIGAQNAGKSTLINAIGKCVGGGGGGGKVVSYLTEAPVPGTTLGIVRVEGVLSGQAKLFDTPGLLNPHQITTRLNREEQKLVHISKEVKPRTYRVKVSV